MEIKSVNVVYFWLKMQSWPPHFRSSCLLWHHFVSLNCKVQKLCLLVKCEQGEAACAGFGTLPNSEVTRKRSAGLLWSLMSFSPSVFKLFKANIFLAKWGCNRWSLSSLPVWYSIILWSLLSPWLHVLCMFSHVDLICGLLTSLIPNITMCEMKST